MVQPPPKVSQPRQNKVFEDLDRPVTPKELRDADNELKLGDETIQKIRELREDILQGRVNATKQRKIELGFLPETKVRATTPAKEIKVKAKYTKEEFERYLETARLLDEQKRKRLAEAINDVIKEAKQ